MRIELDDQSYVSDLVRFLREGGCIAYVGEDASTIEVIRTRSFGKRESDEIRQSPRQSCRRSGVAADDSVAVLILGWSDPVVITDAGG